MVGRPTNTYIVRQGVKFVSDSQSSVGPGSNNSYSNGETVRIQVKLSLNVRWDVRDDLDPNVKPLSVAFMLGDSEKTAEATPAEGKDNNILRFDYTLDSDDGSHSASDLWIPENSVKANDFAFAKTASNVPHQEIHGPCGGADVEHPAVFHPKSSGSPTIISRPKIMSEPLDGDAYYQGEEIWVRVEYSEPVTVSGTPTLTLDVGGTDRQARYVSASTNNEQSLPHPPMDPRRRSSMTRLLFAYEVTGSDSDTDGISIDRGSLSGGPIRAMDNGVTATLNHDGLGAAVEYNAREGGDPTVAKHLVDGSRLPFDHEEPSDSLRSELVDSGTPAHVTSYATRVVSEPASGTTLHAGEYIVVRAEFSEAVVVEDNRLELPIQFFNCYNADFNHIETLEAEHGLNSDEVETYKDSLEAYGCLETNGDRISPTLKYAKYLSGSGHTRLLFWYQIGSADKDRDGIIVPDGNFTYDGGKEITSSIQDSIITADDGAELYTHYSDVFDKPLKYQRADGQAVEGPPIIMSVDITSDPNTGDDDPRDTYEFEDTIQVRVTFNQDVSVTGMPKLTLNLDSGPEDATYASGSDSRLLFFHYTVEAGDRDRNGISINQNSLKLDGGTIVAVDDPLEIASLDHRALGTQGGHKVDAMAPIITGTGISIVSRPPNGGTYYGVGSDIDIQVTYDETVEVSGTPILNIALSTSTQPETRTASYDQTASDADSNDRTIVFRYTVSSPDDDPDGVRVLKGSISGGTIESVSPNPLPADRDFEELRTQSDHKVETVEPTVSSVAIVSDGSCDVGPYQVDDIICVAATFSERIWVDTSSSDPNVELVPYIEIRVGDGQAVQAPCDCDNVRNAQRLVFEYAVQPGDLDTDGISVDRDSIHDGGGKITDQAGNRADLAHDPIAASNSGPDNSVDAIVPTITRGPTLIDGPLSGQDTYGRGQEIKVEFEFSENVSVTGTPLLALEFNYVDSANVDVTAVKQAPYRAHLSTGCASDIDPCKLLFSYIVQAGDIDPDGLSITQNAFDKQSNRSKIMDASRNRADLRHPELETQTGHRVDAAGPIITQILATPDGVHGIDDVITFTVSFDEPIEIDTSNVDTTDTSTANDGLRLRLTIGNSTEYATYTSGGSNIQLLFEYTVVENDLDENGITVPANAMEKRGAVVSDLYGNESLLRNDSKTNWSDHEVDGVRPRVVGNATISSETHPGTSYYGADDEKPITVQARFSEHVVLSSASVKLQIGDDPDDNNERLALWQPPVNYLRDVGIEVLTFSYTVDGPDGDHDDNGISVLADGLVGDITDLAGNAPTLTLDNTFEHGGITNAGAHKVETTRPTVESVVVYSDSPGGDATYHEGDAIMVKVVLSEPVIVPGTPRIDLEFDGGVTKTASFERVLNDNMSLIFTYTVQSGDMDADGFSVKMNTLRHSSDGKITDVPRNEAVLDHSAVDAGLDHKVNGDLMPRGPWVMQAPRITSNPAKINTYGKHNGAFEVITLEVMFSEEVTVSGRPILPLTVGSGPKVDATFSTGSGSDKLIFSYRVNSGDLDPDGVSVDAGTIRGGTIVAEDDQTPALRSVPALDNVPGTHMVDGVAPELDPVPEFTNTPADNETYMKDEVIQVTAHFDEHIIFTGTDPTMQLIIGTSMKTARLTSPTTIDDETGTISLVFEYAVAAGDMDDDGVSLPADGIRGSITDIVGNPLDRTHVSIYGGLNRKVDGGPANRQPTTPGNTGGGGSSPDRIGPDDDRLSVRVERIGGIDRFETAKLIGERYVREISRDRSVPAEQRMVDTVVIASGRAFPDALTASALTGSALSPIALSGPSLAGSRQAPLLLTEPDELPSFTRDFLVENEIKHVYIVGGTGAISRSVETAIAALPSVTSVMRFGGEDRYATSVSIASEVSAMMGGAGEFCGTSLRTALLAVGDDFADALALAPIAARGPHPLLLTRRDALPESVRDFFAAAAELGTIEHVVVAGGAFAVSDSVIDELTEMGLNITRLGGEDRFDTSVRIAIYVLRAAASGQGACLDTNRVSFATGLVYADGLSGGPLMAHLRAPTVLLWPDAVPKQVDGFLSWHLLDHENLTLTVLGGPAALSYGVIRKVRIAVQDVLDLD